MIEIGSTLPVYKRLGLKFWDWETTALIFVPIFGSDRSPRCADVGSVSVRLSVHFIHSGFLKGALKGNSKGNLRGNSRG